MQEIQLPADGDPNDFWVGFTLDWSSSSIQSLQNETGNSSLAEELGPGLLVKTCVGGLKNKSEANELRDI